MSMTDPTTPRFEVAELAHPTPAEMAAVIRIYEEAIPAAERRTAAEFVDATARDTHQLFAASSGDAILGFALLFNGRSVSLLEYMAVDRSQRGAGLGSVLCAAVLAEAARSAPGRPVLAEVDSDDWSAPDLEIRRRRKQFYRRLGFQDLDGVKYRLPLKSAAGLEPMHLMVHGFEDAAPSRETLRRWITELYVDVYGLRQEDPRLSAIDESFNDSVA